MKTKRKKKKERSEEKKLCAESKSGPSTYRAEGFTTRPRGTHKQFEAPCSSLINVNSKIFFRRTTAVSTVKPQRRCITSHLHVNNGSPTV